MCVLPQTELEFSSKYVSKRLNFGCLTPSVYSPGDTYQKHGLTYRKNSRLKYELIEASWVAIRKDPALLENYNKLITKMKKQQAIIRIAKKLLSRIRHVWLNKQPYVTGIVE